MKISQAVNRAHDIALKHGWWDKEKLEPTQFGTLIALVHSELSEALEESRNGRSTNETYYECNMKPKSIEMYCEYPKEEFCGAPEKDRAKCKNAKPCGIPSELADAVIRIFDICGHYNIDLERIIEEKMNYNETRPYKHGGKVF